MHLLGSGGWMSVKKFGISGGTERPPGARSSYGSAVNHSREDHACSNLGNLRWPAAQCTANQQQHHCANCASLHIPHTIPWHASSILFSTTLHEQLLLLCTNCGVAYAWQRRGMQPAMQYYSMHCLAMHGNSTSFMCCIRSTLSVLNLRTGSENLTPPRKCCSCAAGKPCR
jgi:hypothetical protein